MKPRCIVEITAFAEKQLRRVPKYIKEAILIWVEAVQEDGIRKVRILPGYHDEPLKGKGHGLRPVRLNRAYRLFYREVEQKMITVVVVTEINKHDY